MERDVAFPVRDRRVQERDVRRERRQQADVSVRGLDARVAVVLLHRRSDDRPCDDGGQAARRGFEPLREREERPVLDVHLAALVRTAEDRVWGEVGEGVSRVAGDHLADEPTAEEQRPEARQAEHGEREPRVPAPPLAHDLARGRGPARVTDVQMERIAGADVLGDGVAQRGALVGHRPATPATARGRRDATAASPGSRASRRSAWRACNRSARRSPT